jgi:hypothetical protein
MPSWRLLCSGSWRGPPGGPRWVPRRTPLHRPSRPWCRRSRGALWISWRPCATSAAWDAGSGWGAASGGGGSPLWGGFGILAASSAGCVRKQSGVGALWRGKMALPTMLTATMRSSLLAALFATIISLSRSATPLPHPSFLLYLPSGEKLKKRDYSFRQIEIYGILYSSMQTTERFAPTVGADAKPS